MQQPPRSWPALSTHPGRVALHAVGLPELFRGVLRQRLADGVGDQDADKVGFAGVVGELRARLVGPRQGLHVAHDRVDAGLHDAGAGAGDVGVGVGVILVPLHARAHGEEVADADAVIGRALELGDVGRHLIVDRLDLAVLDGGADQRRGDRLGDREGDPAVLGLAAEPVALEHHLAVLHDHHARDVVGLHVVVDRPALVGMAVAQLVEDGASALGNGRTVSPRLTVAVR